MKGNTLKKVLGFALAATMTAALAGCGSSDAGSSDAASSAEASSAAASSTTALSSSAASDSASEEAGKSFKVGVVVKFQHEFYSELMQGAEDACNELGLEYTGMAPKAADDVTGQVSMVEDMVTNGVDLLIVAPNQEETLYNAFDTAVENGAKIIAADTDITGYENKTAFVGTNNKEALKTAGKELAALIPEGSDVVILRGPLGDANHEARAEGATEGLEEAGCNVLEVKDSGSTAEGAAAAMEDFMTRYPDQIKGVLCCDDDMAAGAIKAVEQAGKLEEIKISGFDGTEVGVNNVAEGKQVFDLSQNPYQMGYQAVYVGYDALNGKDVEANNDTGVQMITSENYKDFQ